MDLHPKTVSNHEMGLVFEELTRRFAEGSNETAGEHFAPRDIVRLTTSLVFMVDDEALRDQGIIRTIYNPTAGTGGFLSSGMEYVHELNEGAVIRAFGQELNAESYAICKGDILIKGQDVSRVKLGNTLSDDQLAGDQFDYMLSNPPFGVDWKKIEESIKTENKVKEPDQKSTRGRPSSKKKAAKKIFGCKIFESHEFGYRRITIERPPAPECAVDQRAHCPAAF